MIILDHAGLPVDGVNQVWRVSSTASGGTFRATVGAKGHTFHTKPTSAVATASTVLSALVALGNIDPGDLTCTGGPLGTEDLILSGAGSLIGLPFSIEIDSTAAVGGTVSASQEVLGVSGTLRGINKNYLVIDTTNSVLYINIGTAKLPLWSALSTESGTALLLGLAPGGLFSIPDASSIDIDKANGVVQSWDILTDANRTINSMSDGSTIGERFLLILPAPSVWDPANSGIFLPANMHSEISLEPGVGHAHLYEFIWDGSLWQYSPGIFSPDIPTDRVTIDSNGEALTLQVMPGVFEHLAEINGVPVDTGVTLVEGMVLKYVAGTGKWTPTTP